MRAIRYGRDANLVRPGLVFRGLEEELHSKFEDANLWVNRLRDANFRGPESREGAKVVRDLIESAMLVGDPGSWNCWSSSDRIRFDPLGQLRQNRSVALRDPSFGDGLRAYQSLRLHPNQGFEAWRAELLQNPGPTDVPGEATRMARLLSILEAALTPDEQLDGALEIDFFSVEGLNQDPALSRLGFLQRELRNQKRSWDFAKRHLQEQLELKGVSWPSAVPVMPRYPFYKDLASFRTPK